MPLDTPFAQELCDLLHAELGLVCSFMDADGRIVASSERQRQSEPKAQPMSSTQVTGVNRPACDAGKDKSCPSQPTKLI